MVLGSETAIQWSPIVSSPFPDPSPASVVLSYVSLRQLVRVVRRDLGVRVGRCTSVEGVLPDRGLAKPRDLGRREGDAGIARGEKRSVLWEGGDVGTRCDVMTCGVSCDVLRVVWCARRVPCHEMRRY